MATPAEEKLLNELRRQKNVPEEIKRNPDLLRQLVKYVSEVLRDKTDLNNPQNDGLVEQQVRHMQQMNPTLIKPLRPYL